MCYGQRTAMNYISSNKKNNLISTARMCVNEYLQRKINTAVAVTAQIITIIPVGRWHGPYITLS